MADPARVRPDLQPNADPRLNDPLSPTPPMGTPETDPRYTAANQDPRVDNRPVVESRGAGSGVIVAAIVVALAIAAYFAFAPGPSETPPVTPAPDASAPASPATPATPAPDASAPAAPAAPTTTAPDATAPAQPAPAAPAAPAN